MIFLSILLSLNSHALVSRGKVGVSGTHTKNVSCKEVSMLAGDKCNVCSVTLCTDRKTQWQEGPRSCTANYCSRNDRHDQKPYNPNDWKLN